MYVVELKEQKSDCKVGTNYEVLLETEIDKYIKETMAWDSINSAML
jgi:hypothetical protein